MSDSDLSFDLLTWWNPWPHRNSAPKPFRPQLLPGSGTRTASINFPQQIWLARPASKRWRPPWSLLGLDYHEFSVFPRSPGSRGRQRGQANLLKTVTVTGEKRRLTDVVTGLTVHRSASRSTFMAPIVADRLIFPGCHELQVSTRSWKNGRFFAAWNWSRPVVWVVSWQRHQPGRLFTDSHPRHPSPINAHDSCSCSDLLPLTCWPAPVC